MGGPGRGGEDDEVDVSGDGARADVAFEEEQA